PARALAPQRSGGPCDDAPWCDGHAEPELPPELRDLGDRHGSAALKRVLGFAFGKGAALCGRPVVGALPELILGALLPSSRSIQPAMEEIEYQLQTLASAIQGPL